MKKIIVTIALLSFGLFFSQKSQNYFEISYSSICCGTPSTGPVTSYLSQFQKKNKTKAFEVFQQPGLGREGEFNLYIGVDQLSKSQKTIFMKGLKTAISSQNTKRNESRDGIVYFESSKTVTKSDLASIKNLKVYKNNLTK